MSCSCFISEGDRAELSSEKKVKARIKHRCCECCKVIEKGELYERVTGKWDGNWGCYQTCSDCSEIRDLFFCEWIYGRLWEDMREHLGYGVDVPWSDIGKLSESARNKVLESIEEMWEDE